MAALGVGDAHGQLVLGQVDGRLAHDGVCRILEVDGDDAADSTGGLVHQAAGLVEEDVLGILADLGDLDLGEFLHVVIVVLSAQDGTDADLEGSGAGQAGAAQHVAGGVGVKAADLAARVDDTGGHAADQGCGVLLLLLLRDQVGHVHIVDLLKAQGLDADDVLLVGETTATMSRLTEPASTTPLLWSVWLPPISVRPGGGVEAHGAPGAKLVLELVDDGNVTLTLGVYVHISTVKFYKSCIIGTLLDLLFQFNGVRHNCTRLSVARLFSPVCTK